MKNKSPLHSRIQRKGGGLALYQTFFMTKQSYCTNKEKADRYVAARGMEIKIVNESVYSQLSPFMSLNDLVNLVGSQPHRAESAHD